MKFGQLVGGLFRRSDASYNQFIDRKKRETKKGGVLTVVQVVTQTAPKTFSGDAVYVTHSSASDGSSRDAAATKQAPTTANVDSTTEKTFKATKATPTSTANASSAAATSHAAASSSAAASSTAVSSTPASSIATITSSPPSSATLGAATSATPTKEATSSQSKGMTGGAKAGLAFGILAIIGVVIAGVLLLYRRKKKQAEAMERLDDEKSAMTKPDTLPYHPQPLPPVPTDAQAPAPQVSLRPVTQFDPRMSGVSPAEAAAGAPAAKSSWEKRGADKHANDPTNPFGNHAETLNNSPPKTSVPGVALTTGAAAVAGAALAAGAQKRAPSPGHIDAADFPLPASGPPSPKPTTPTSNGTGVLSTNAPTSTSTLPSSLQVGEAGATAAADAIVGGAAGNKSKGPPAGPGADNVHRVQLDFKPSMEDELEIRAGQLVRMLHEYDDGWALCIRMDRSQQGVVPRTCLSKHVIKPRPAGPSQGRSGGPGSPGSPGPRGPPQQMRGPPSGRNSPSPYGPGTGRNSPAPYGQAPRPLTPTGRNSPAPYPGGRASPLPYNNGGRNSPAPFAQAPRPLSPAGRPPQGRARAASNASPYVAYQPQNRSMSPGPYGAGQLRPTQRPENQRRRSNSMSNLTRPDNSPPTASPLGASSSRLPMPISQIPARKPVPGQAV